MSLSLSARLRLALMTTAAVALLIGTAPAGFALPAQSGTVVFGAPTSSPPITTGGANSASSGTATCPTGTAMVGAQTETTQSPDTTFIDYPYKFTPICAALTATPTAVVPSTTTVAGTLLQSCPDATCAVVNQKPSVAGSASCPAGTVVTQFEAVTGQWTDDFILGCQALAADGSPTGAVTWLSRLGGNHNPNPASSPDPCPGGAVAVGLGALTGSNYFQNPALICSVVTVNETLTFVSEGGTAVPPQTVAYGQHAKAPTAPTKRGFTFAGWFTAASGGTAFVFSAPLHSNVTVYAHWTAVPVKHQHHHVGPSVDTGAQLVAAGSGSGPSWPLELGLVAGGMLLVAAAARLLRRR